MTDTIPLWRAVDAITEPTTRRVQRADDADWLDELAQPAPGVCRVDDYRAATLAHGKVPSLWQQTTWALGTAGSEQGEGGGRSPLRERSPADMDLMETMSTIREVLGQKLDALDLKKRPGVPAQMRQLATWVATNRPEHVEWWTFRFEQWGRLLTAHLNALDKGPKPRRLRNSACPQCAATSVVIEGADGTPVVAPPLLIDFTSDGHVRAAVCGSCNYAWFRGADMELLAEQLGCRTA